ncbi:MAG: cytochrome [Herbaspirillum sp.]|nr:cytochrome [Herbaspirillum sp.]
MAIIDKHIGHHLSNDICDWEPGEKLGTALRFCLSAFAALILFANTSHAQTAVGGDTGAPVPSTVTCIACHGALGAGSSAAMTPRLAGQNPDYLAHALSMFKDRTRASDVMQGVAQNLSDSDIHALAIYFSKQHPPLAQGGPAPDPNLVTAGKQLAEMGAGPGLAACFSCHAAGGKGNGARFPSIAGQPETFLINRLHDFQGRAKKSPPAPGTMTAVSATMTEAQIRQAAAYLSSIEP